jgi:hypothetical protein
MRPTNGTLLSEYGLPTMLVVLGLLVLLLILCLLGATAGFESLRMRQSMGLMGPVWFVASALGALIIGFIFLGMLATLTIEYVQEWRARRNHSSSPPEQ